MRVVILIWSVLLALALSGTIASRYLVSSRPPTTQDVSPGRENEKPYAEQEEHNPAISFVQPTPTRRTPQALNQGEGNGRKNDEQRSQGDGPKVTDWVQGISAAIGVFVAVCLLVATGRQIRIAERQAISMDGQLKATEAAAIAAAESARIAEKTLVVSQRPWLKVEASIGGPLVYNTNGMNITTRFTITNVGQSPALQVRVDLIPFLNTKHGKTVVTEGIRLQENINTCSTSGYGIAIFPKDTRIIAFTQPIPQDEIDEVLATRNKGHLTWVFPILLGAVVYKSAFSKDVHQTGFQYSISRVDPSKPGVPQIIKVAMGDIPAELLSLESQWWFRSTYTD